jgi:hypothetical protein
MKPTAGRWALLIVQDRLRCRFAHFKLGGHFLQARGKRLNLPLLLRNRAFQFRDPLLLLVEFIEHALGTR